MAIATDTDIFTAFDNVKSDILINKLLEINLNMNYIKLIAQFLYSYRNLLQLSTLSTIFKLSNLSTYLPK